MPGGSREGRSSREKEGRTIVFLHPDLGIGGAERLVIDAAVGLQKRGHRVVIYTSHCDPAHCFEEARDGTLDVRVRGDWPVPPSLLGRFAILCAILRQAHLVLHAALLTAELRDLAPDAFFVDQLSAGLPLLKLLLLPCVPVLFYCHFPDLLLAQGRARWWKRAYRAPFDAVERWSMGFADAVAVNSAFTKGVVTDTWPSLARTTELRVVYPCIGLPDTAQGQTTNDQTKNIPWKGKKIILSINRFERKKDIALAIRAFAGLSDEQRKDARLVVAGGYDNRVSENVQYHSELVALAESLHLNTATTKTVVTALSVPPDVDVLFLLSVPGTLKDMLLRSARLLVYTPAHEHFGIVPLEAMRYGVPVLAANTGGPTETVLDGATGWLRDPAHPERWTDVMDLALNQLDTDTLGAMARAAAERVQSSFSDVQLAERLDGVLDEIVARGGKGVGSGMAVAVAVAVLVGVVAAALAGVGISAALAGVGGGCGTVREGRRSA